MVQLRTSGYVLTGLDLCGKGIGRARGGGENAEKKNHLCLLDGTVRGKI